MENTASYLPETSSVWSAFKNIYITEIVETTCSSTGTGRQAPETHQSRELHPDSSYRAWTFVHLSTDEILPKDFDLDRVLWDLGITIGIVPFIVEHKGPGYKLIVATQYLGLLSERFRDFKVVVIHDPFEPAEEDIRIHGIWEAKERARTIILNAAAELIRNGWGDGSAEWIRGVIEEAGLGTELQRAILNWDIQHSNPRTLEHFAQNLLFLCLNCCDRYDTPSVLDILGRDQNEWLQPFQNGHTDLSKVLLTADLPVWVRKGQELQTILLFRRLIELSGGKVDCRQHDFGIDYTANQNASLCVSFLGVSCSGQFGRFDPEEMQDALSKSKLFAELSKPDLPDTIEWSLRVMKLVPVGFPENYLNLPSQLLYGFSTRQVDQIRLYLEHTYRRFPSLRKEENNILLLLTWSSTYQGQTHEVLSDWIESEESLTLYRRLIEDVRLEQSSEEFALTLAALLCRERLLPYTMDDTAEPIGGSYLTDFDTIVNGQDISNRRTVFEEMILSLVRVLYTLNTNEEAARFLTEVLGKDASLLKLLDGVADQYCVRKLCRHEHNSAIEEVRHGLLECVQAMLKGDGNADTEWVVIP